MIAFIFASLAFAGPTDMVGELAALDSHDARSARLTQAITEDAAQAARYGAALSVVAALKASNRSDPSIVRMFLMAALSDDANLREAAVKRAQEGGDPPTAGAQPQAAPPPPPAVASGPSPAALQAVGTYKSRHLMRDRWQYSVTTVSSSQYGAWASTSNVSTWAVYQGGTNMLRPLAFAQTVGDAEGVARLEKAKRRRTSGLVVGIAGAMFMAVSPLTLLAFEDDLDTGLAVSLGVLGAGTAMLLPGLLGYMGSQRRLTFPSRTWSPTEADQWVSDYNDRLRGELGLTPVDTREVDGL